MIDKVRLKTHGYLNTLEETGLPQLYVSALE